MKNRGSIKILLLQIRKDRMKQHEYDCFLRYSKLRSDQLVSLDVFKDKISVEKLKDYDAVIIGGSGEFDVLDKEMKEINKQLKEIIYWCHDNNFPYLGACYGHQLAGLVMGGEVIAEQHKEVGSFEIFTTKEAEKDPLFKHLPQKFWAQLGHRYSVIKLPPKAILLAYSKKCPIEAFTFPNKKFYAVQFHTELDKDDLIFRISYYKGYVKNKQELEKMIQQTKNSSEAAQFTSLFIDKVVLNK